MSDAQKTNAVDIAIGKNIRNQRLIEELSLASAAARIGITYQQLQKYETAETRVSASRLIEIARGLDCRVETFFVGIA